MGIKLIFERLMGWNSSVNKLHAAKIQTSKYFGGTEVIADTGSRLRSKSPMNFTVHSANGGKIIQISKYNETTHDDSVELYIITDKENLGEELGHIITRDTLAR